MTTRAAPDGVGRDTLAAAVSALCDPERVAVERDPVAVKAAHAGAVRLARESTTSPKDVDQVLAAFKALKAAASKWSERPSLLSQLRDGAEVSREVAERAGGGIRIPINPDAIDLLDRIRGTVRNALDLLGLPPRQVDDPTLDPIRSDLRRLVVAHWAGVEGGEAERARLARRIERHTVLARQVIDPDPGGVERSARDTPCPECGALYVTEQRDGDTERVPALRLDFVTPQGPEAAEPVRLLRGVACRACGHYVWREGSWDETSGEFVPAGEFAALRESVAAYAAALSEWAAGLRAAGRAERESRYPSPRRSA